MEDFPGAELLDAMRSDRSTRLRQHEDNCVLLAVVTPEALAGELIDKAIAFQAEARKLQQPSKATGGA